MRKIVHTTKALRHEVRLVIDGHELPRACSSNVRPLAVQQSCVGDTRINPEMGDLRLDPVCGIGPRLSPRDFSDLYPWFTRILRHGIFATT